MRKFCYLFTLIIIFSGLFCFGCGSGLPSWKEKGYDVGPRVVEEGVRFAIYAPEAESVTLAGTFNNWSRISDPLQDKDANGVWKIVLPLSPGRYEYKFVIDGEEWIPDPANPDTVKDGFGGKNSVIRVE